MSLAQKIDDWSTPEPNSGCVLFFGGRNSNGYGMIAVGGGDQVPVHRAAFELAHGPIPEGLVIDHLCRVRVCVNPRHMEAVTNVENVMRGVSPAAVNAKRTHCENGHLFDAENTFVAKNGWRKCRTCRRASDRAKYARRAREQA